MFWGSVPACPQNTHTSSFCHIGSRFCGGGGGILYFMVYVIYCLIQSFHCKKSLKTIECLKGFLGLCHQWYIVNDISFVWGYIYNLLCDKFGNNRILEKLIIGVFLRLLMQIGYLEYDVECLQYLLDCICPREFWVLSVWLINVLKQKQNKTSNLSSPRDKLENSKFVSGSLMKLYIS